jgi:hypothetical protein
MTTVMHFMTTITFKIPEEVKNTFSEMFGKNQNVIITSLMMQAIKEEKRKREEIQAIDALSALQPSAFSVTAQDITTAHCERKR